MEARDSFQGHRPQVPMAFSKVSEGWLCNDIGNQFRDLSSGDVSVGLHERGVGEMVPVVQPFFERLVSVLVEELGFECDI